MITELQLHRQTHHSESSNHTDRQSTLGQSTFCVAPKGWLEDVHHLLQMMPGQKIELYCIGWLAGESRVFPFAGEQLQVKWDSHQNLHGNPPWSATLIQNWLRTARA